MEILDWIDKNHSEIQNTLLYGKYFDSIHLEEGTDVFYLLNPHKGIDIILRNDLTVKAIHFYSGEQKEVKSFTDELPFDLNFSFSRTYIRQVFGNPNETGGGDYSILYGRTPFWDKFKYENFYLHLQFSEDGESIDLVTIGSLN